jgi:hypothetical protein
VQTPSARSNSYDAFTAFPKNIAGYYSDISSFPFASCLTACVIVPASSGGELASDHFERTLLFPEFVLAFPAEWLIIQHGSQNNSMQPREAACSKWLCEVLRV